jgi:hypothetical protein
MSFFPPDPEMSEPEHEEDATPAWYGPPSDELPALLPHSVLLASTDHVSVALAGVRVYREGVELLVERRLRRLGLGYREWEIASTAFSNRGFAGDPHDGGRLRYGVVLDGGTSLLADGGLHLDRDPRDGPLGHSLTQTGGGGGGGLHSYSFSDGLWLWPTPPAGTLELVMQWPAQGIEETRVQLDATRLRELASGARPFWT